MICGTATDPAGAVLAGVTVTLASGAVAAATTKTSAAGERLERSLLTSSAQTDPVVPVGYGRHAAGGTFTKEVVTNSGAKPAPPRHPCSAPR